MFNVFRSRDKLVRYVLGGLLLIVAISMITYLIPGYGLGTTTMDDTVIADIGSDKLTAAEVQNTVQRFVAAGQMPTDLLEIYVPQFIEQMLRQRAAVYQFEKLGVTVSDQEVLIGMMSENPTYFKDGQLIQRQQFEDFLAQQGMTLQDAITNMRRQLILRKVQDTVLSGAVVTPKEVDEALVQGGEKAKIQYIAFAPAKFTDQVKISDEDLKQFFESNRRDYSVPEKRAFQVVVVDQAKIEAAMVVSDTQLRAAYSASMDNFRIPERVKVRHILLQTANKSDTEKKQIEAKAQDLLKQIKGGANFAEIAKKSSEDPGSGQKGGDLDWIVRGQTVPEFEKVAFSLKPTELSGVVTTQYGYHIIQVMEKEAARVKPFDEVKASLADEVKKQSINDKMQSTADQIRAALEKAPGSAEAVTKQFDAQLVVMTKEAAGDPIPTLGVTPEIDSALLTMKKNEVSPVLALPANRLAVVVLNDRLPAHPAELSDVTEQVKSRMISQRSQVLASDAAEQAASKVRAGEDIEKVAKSMKLEAVTSGEFGRTDSIDGIGPSSYVQDSFAKPVGTVIGPLNIQGQNYVCKIIDKKIVQPSQDPKQRENALAELKQKKAVAQNELFMDSVLTAMQADGTVRIHPEVMQRVVAQFRR